MNKSTRHKTKSVGVAALRVGSLGSGCPASRSSGPHAFERLVVAGALVSSRRRSTRRSGAKRRIIRAPRWSGSTGRGARRRTGPRAKRAPARGSSSCRVSGSVISQCVCPPNACMYPSASAAAANLKRAVGSGAFLTQVSCAGKYCRDVCVAVSVADALFGASRRRRPRWSRRGAPSPPCPRRPPAWTSCWSRRRRRRRRRARRRVP